MDKIYVIGHKSPDLDSIVAAISYAKLKNLKENTDIYVPARAGEINKATEFVLNKFGYEAPELLENAKDKKIILVDHNEAGQIVDGGDMATIVEILDHHKLNFNYSEPIEVLVRPWGSSNSIVASLYYQNHFEIEKNLAGLMLSAILDDTVITKSPTCTEKDKKFINELANIAGVADWELHGLDIFKAKSSVNSMAPAEIVKVDFKDFEMKAGKLGIGQVETVDLSEFDNKLDDLKNELGKLKESEGYHSIVLFITDIMKEGSLFLVSTNEEAKMNMALGKSLENGQAFLEGIMSRKKQVVPMLSKVFDI